MGAEETRVQKQVRTSVSHDCVMGWKGMPSEVFQFHLKNFFKDLFRG